MKQQQEDLCAPDWPRSPQLQARSGACMSVHDGNITLVLMVYTSKIWHTPIPPQKLRSSSSGFVSQQAPCEGFHFCIYTHYIWTRHGLHGLHSKGTYLWRPPPALRPSPSPSPPSLPFPPPSPTPLIFPLAVLISTLN